MIQERACAVCSSVSLADCHLAGAAMMLLWLMMIHPRVFPQMSILSELEWNHLGRPLASAQKVSGALMISAEVKEDKT